jgi:hypothetical protein
MAQARAEIFVVEDNPAEGNHHQKDDPQHGSQFVRLVDQEQERGYEKDGVDPPADQEAKISKRIVVQNVPAIVSPGGDKCDFRANISPDSTRAVLLSNSRQKEGANIDRKPDAEEHPEEQTMSFHDDSMAAIRIVSILGSISVFFGVLRTIMCFKIGAWNFEDPGFVH